MLMVSGNCDINFSIIYMKIIPIFHFVTILKRSHAECEYTRKELDEGIDVVKVQKKSDCRKYFF